jgi:hypothetical protein
VQGGYWVEPANRRRIVILFGRYNCCMGWIEWAFSGLGASLVIFVLGFFGTKAVQRRRSVRQVQKAGDNATQIQSGRDTRADS